MIENDEQALAVVLRDALHAEAYRLVHGYADGSVAGAVAESREAMAHIHRRLAAPASHDAQRIACETCRDHGLIGGPSYSAPDEGGVPCPDCTTKPEAAGALAGEGDESVAGYIDRLGERIRRGMNDVRRFGLHGTHARVMDDLSDEAITYAAALSAAPVAAQQPAVVGDGVREYLQHHDWCAYNSVRDSGCTCGLTTALTPAATPVPDGGGQEPITIEAVGIVCVDPERGHYVDWLVEGGVSALVPGELLLVAPVRLTDDTGAGEVYTHPPEQSRAVAGVVVENFIVGRTYPMRGGGTVKLVSIHNAGTHHETMACADDVHRYTRRLHPADHGRVTGTDGTDPRDVMITPPAADADGGAE